MLTNAVDFSIANPKPNSPKAQPMQTTVKWVILWPMFMLILASGLWTCKNPCPKCPDRESQSVTFIGPCSVKLDMVTPVRFMHIDSAGGTVSEGVQWSPRTNFIFVALEDGHKLYYVENGVVAPTRWVEMEVQTGAEYLMGLKLPYALSPPPNCAPDDEVQITGQLQFPGIINPPLPEDVTIFDGLDPNRSASVGNNYFFSIPLLRDTQAGNRCRVSLGVAYPNTGGSREVRLNFTHVTDLGDIMVVLGDRVKDNSLSDTRPD